MGVFVDITSVILTTAQSLPAIHHGNILGDHQIPSSVLWPNSPSQRPSILPINTHRPLHPRYIDPRSTSPRRTRPHNPLRHIRHLPPQNPPHLQPREHLHPHPIPNPNPHRCPLHTTLCAAPSRPHSNR